MKNSNRLTPEERAKITEIQDMLIDRYVEQKEVLEEGKRARAIELEFEIKELRHEMEHKRMGGWLTCLADKTEAGLSEEREAVMREQSGFRTRSLP